MKRNFVITGKYFAPGCRKNAGFDKGGKRLFFLLNLLYFFSIFLKTYGCYNSWPVVKIYFISAFL